jgi:hypothetical protein
MNKKFFRSYKSDASGREKLCFSGTLRWWDASLVGRFAGRTLRWSGLGQLEGIFGMRRLR